MWWILIVIGLGLILVNLLLRKQARKAEKDWQEALNMKIAARKYHGGKAKW